MEAVDSATPVRRARRFDPDRRDHILTVALDVLADHGLDGLTQRRVAAAADVPLGSVTYHFPSRDDLVLAAFARFVQEQSALFAGRFGGIATREDLIETLTALVAGGPDRLRAGVLGFELYLLALRDPRARDLTAAWTAESRTALARLMEPTAAADLDAYLEGLILHVLVSPTPTPTEVVRASVTRFVDAIPLLHPTEPRTA
jgi:DNA-binding transcriptional regulator YbjK